MITREEAIKGYMINGKHVIAEMLYDTITKYEERIKSLEAHLNTEQLTCDGCKYNRFGSGSNGIAVDCTLWGYGCKRSMLDRYEPKDTQ